MANLSATAERPSHLAEFDHKMDAQPEIEPAAISGEPLGRLLVRLGALPVGLQASEARERLVRYGPNDAGATKRTPP